MSSYSLGGIDVAIVVAALVAVSLLASRAARRQTSARDFFVGGRSLPWWAVSASLIATEISAITYVSLPGIVGREGGNLTYLQIGLFGYVGARVLVAWLLLPAYYRADCWSPYDLFVSRFPEAGETMRRTATVLFTIGGVLAQASRVYLTALVLELLLSAQLLWVQEFSGLPPRLVAIVLLFALALLWTWLGGVTAVIWTDAALFVLFVVGAFVCIGAALPLLPDGLAELLRSAGSEGKLQLIDPSPSLSTPYTLLAALLGASIGGLATFGTDQLMTQRLLCCRSEREARRAVVVSGASVLVSGLFAFVGLVIWGVFSAQPMTADGARLVAEAPDRLLTVFVLEVIPVGLKGVVIAGVLAAAVSSLDSVLAALGQTTLALLPAAVREGSESLRISRRIVLAWCVVLGVVAALLEPLASHYGSLLDLALAMAGYTVGALLAGVLMALRPAHFNARAYPVAATSGVLCVVGAAWHVVAAQVVLAAAVAGLVVVSKWSRLRIVVPGVAGLFALALSRYSPSLLGGDLAWPWYAPLGCLVTLIVARLALQAPDQQASEKQLAT